MFAAQRKYGTAITKCLFMSKRFYSADLTQVMGPRRAIVYKNTGAPSDVLYSTTDSRPLQLGSNEVLVRLLLSPVNPADVSTTTSGVSSSLTLQRS
jgi:hypothetical protein